MYVRRGTLCFLMCGFSLWASASAAQAPYVVVQDDGQLASFGRDPSRLGAAANALLSDYRRTGSAVPDVLSVWTTFPMGGENISTLFLPIGNAVQGVGLEHEYRGDGITNGTFPSQLPPMQALLLHNNIMAMPERAAASGAPEEGFASYLFLLEFSHLMGPAMRLRGGDDSMIGFSFHWSFFLDAGRSPAGGNAWTDHGDGTFTVSGQLPSTVAYSDLDLYALGLLDASEVRPFALLSKPTVPKGAVDGTGSSITPSSFPWFATEPLTISAIRVTHTIEEIIEANGPRVPAFKDAPKDFRVGIVLVVGEDDDEQAILSARRVFDPIAASLSLEFARATRGLGSLTIVTESKTPAIPDAGVSTTADAGAEQDTGLPAEPAATSRKKAGCSIAAGRPPETPWLMIIGIAFLWAAAWHTALTRRLGPNAGDEVIR